jgi:transposase
LTRKTQNNFYKNKEWLKECPKSVKQGAVKEARANLAACYTNRRRGNIETFEKPFKTKKREMLKGWSFELEKANIVKQDHKLFVFKTLLGEMKYCGTKQLHKIIPEGKPLQDCKVQKTEFGEYYLIVPYVCKQKKPAPKEITNPGSGDPGGRKFLTTYSPVQKESFILGNRAASTIMEELLSLDKMISELSKEKDAKKRCKLQGMIRVKRRRVFNLKVEMRFQVANFISKRYDLFMMPKLEVGKLSEKAGRKLKTKAVRQLLNLGHSKFFDTLKDKCWENGSIFLHVREEYTSQTCPCCGALNKCGELYKCKDCGFQHDRDVVGALNIFLKGVRLTNPGAFGPLVG